MLILIGPTGINGVWTAASLAFPTTSLDMQAKIGAPLKQWNSASHFQGAPLTATNCANGTMSCATSSSIVSRSSSSASSTSSTRKEQQHLPNNRYKTELCRSIRENGICRYGDKCQFAHRVVELRKAEHHPKYKTELCKTFHEENFCKYGERCHFVHDDRKNRVLSNLSTSSAGPGHLSSANSGPGPVPMPMQQQPSVQTHMQSYMMVMQQAYAGLPIMVGRQPMIQTVPPPMYPSTQYTQMWDQSGSGGEESSCSIGPFSSGSNSPNSYSPGLSHDKEADDFNSYDSSRQFMSGYQLSGYVSAASTPQAHPPAPVPVDLPRLDPAPSRSAPAARSRLPVFRSLTEGQRSTVC